MQSIVRRILPDRSDLFICSVLPEPSCVFFVRRNKKNSFCDFFAGIATVCPLFKFLSFHVVLCWLETLKNNGRVCRAADMRFVV